MCYVFYVLRITASFIILNEELDNQITLGFTVTFSLIVKNDTSKSFFCDIITPPQSIRPGESKNFPKFLRNCTYSHIKLM
jgi:hypothetical protein